MNIEIKVITHPPFSRFSGGMISGQGLVDRHPY